MKIIVAFDLYIQIARMFARIDIELVIPEESKLESFYTISNTMLRSFDFAEPKGFRMTNITEIKND